MARTQDVDITVLLKRLGQGDDRAIDELAPLVYDELRRLARRQLRKGGSGRRTPTLDTTALAHEAFLKLSAANATDWQDRCHFMAVAATSMRHILVDYARRRNAQRRGSGAPHISLDDHEIAVDAQAENLLSVDQALDRLGNLSPRLGRVVECRFFAGMTNRETAAALNLTERTIRRDWVKAKAWLHRELSADAPAG